MMRKVPSRFHRLHPAIQHLQQQYLSQCAPLGRSDADPHLGALYQR
jgi:hypothetical protein